MTRILRALGELAGRVARRTGIVLRAGAVWFGGRLGGLLRVLRVDAVLRWYGGHRVVRQWTVNLAGAALLIWFAGVAGDWIQPTLTPDMLFPSANIGAEAVRVAEAQPGVVQRIASYTGAVQPWEENVVYARIDGYVNRLLVYPGEHVRQGQLLATLETSRLDPLLEEALADSVFLAAEFRRDSVLVAQQAIGVAEFERSRTRYAAASAKVQHLRTQIGYAAIRALTSGWVAQRHVYAGQYVRAGEPVVKVDRLDRVRIQFQVAEEHLSAIRPGGAVYLRFPQLDPEQVFAAWPRRTLRPAEEQGPAEHEGGPERSTELSAQAASGGTRSVRGPPDVAVGTGGDASLRTAATLPQSEHRLAKHAPAVAAEVAIVFPAEDPGTRTGTVEVHLNNPGPLLRTNTYVVGDFVVRQGARGVRVPVSALTPMPGGRTVVFVVPPMVSDGAVEERTVTVGVRNAEYAEILSGIEPGERVVYQGNRGLVDGQLVTVLSSERGR